MLVEFTEQGYLLVESMVPTAGGRTTGWTSTSDERDAPEWRMLGCFGPSCTQAQAAASPVSYVDPGDPPVLLIVGAGDKMVPYHQTMEMAETLKSADVPHELIVIPEVDTFSLGSLARKRVRRICEL